MGRTVDFAKRRIAGYLVFWFVVLLVVYVLYRGNQLSAFASLVVLGLAFFISLAYTRRMKRRQRATRQVRSR